MDIKFPLDGLTFSAVELDIYVEPPKLSEDVSDEDKKTAWSNWIIENTRWRGVHKRLFDRKQKTESLPDHQYIPTIIKRNGVYKQIMGPVGFEGSYDEGSGKLVLFEQAKQDRHFRSRGNRGQRGNKHKSTRANRRDRKRKQLLSKKKTFWRP